MHPSQLSAFSEYVLLSFKTPSKISRLFSFSGCWTNGRNASYSPEYTYFASNYTIASLRLTLHQIHWHASSVFKQIAFNRMVSSQSIWKLKLFSLLAANTTALGGGHRVFIGGVHPPPPPHPTPPYCTTSRMSCVCTHT